MVASDLFFPQGFLSLGSYNCFHFSIFLEHNGCIHIDMSNESQRYVAYTVEDRQWDARFNVQRDEDLEELVASIKRHWESGALRYILVGGPEIGTRPLQDDYQIRHVHVAAVFHNRISKRSILQHWGVKVRCFC